MKLNRQFWWLEILDGWSLFYDMNKKKWVSRKEYTGNCYPASFPCATYKSALRHLKKHDEIPKGTKFRLVSKLVGCDRIITK